MISSMLPYASLLVSGAVMTLLAWICASILSLGAGIFFGILACHHFSFTRLSRLITLYTFIARGVPAYVQILIAYFVIPSLLHINVSGFFAASCALAFCSSGYTTEIIRAGINALPAGQWDAAFVLGYGVRATLTRIIMPQAVRIIFPALMGECEQLLKSTSLLATIGVTELTRMGMNIISRELNPLPVYLTIACIYLFFSACLHFVTFSLKRRL